MTLGQDLPYLSAGGGVPDAPQSPPASDDSAGSGFGGAPHGLYSIRGHFDASCSVFLTGATGYIGSLVLEKLLRSTAVGRVYVLVRARRGTNPADRVSRLLQGPLFHLITPEQAARVTAVAGDIMQPGLGLSDDDRATLEAEVDTVLHSAAGGRGLRARRLTRGAACRRGLAAHGPGRGAVRVEDVVGAAGRGAIC